MWFTVTTNFGTGESVSNTTTLRLECNSVSPTNSSSYEIGTVSYGINPQFQAWKDEFEGKKPGDTPTPTETTKETTKETPKEGSPPTSPSHKKESMVSKLKHMFSK